MGDDLQRTMAERMSRMRAQALRGRTGGGMMQVKRTTEEEDDQKANFRPSLPVPQEQQQQQQQQQGRLSTATTSASQGLQWGSTGSSSYNAQSGTVPTTTRRADSDSEDEGAEKLRLKLQQMGISETVTPLFHNSEPQAAVRGSPKLDVSDKRSFLGRAPPRVGMIYCHIVRDRSGMKKLHPEYTLYLESGGDEPLFLLAARKRKKNKTSNYLVSMDPEDLTRNSGNFYGKVRSNFLGTEFTIYDKGEKPSREGGLAQRQELAAVLYESNIVGSKGPRRMVAVVPSVDEQGKRAQWKPDKDTEDSESIIQAYKAGERKDDMMVLENKKPTWNEELRAYVLNFKGRVSVASVKNFQLVERHTENVLVQFGKVASDKFTMDFQYPVNGLQAFCIALTAFDNKLACE